MLIAFCLWDCRLLKSSSHNYVPRPRRPLQAVVLTKSGGESAEGLGRIVLKYAAVLAAALYFSGWLYLYHFYKLFEIDVSMLQLSNQEVILYSAQVVYFITRKALGFPLVLVTFIVLPAALHLAFRLRNRWGPALALIDDYNKRLYVPLLLALLCPAVIIWLAQSAALEKARHVRISPAETAALQLKSACKNPELDALNEAGALRVLAATQKWYFVFAQTGERKADRIASIDLFHIPTDCVLSASFLVRHPAKVGGPNVK